MENILDILQDTTTQAIHDVRFRKFRNVVGIGEIISYVNKTVSRIRRDYRNESKTRTNLSKKYLGECTKASKVIRVVNYGVQSIMANKNDVIYNTPSERGRRSSVTIIFVSEGKRIGHL